MRILIVPVISKPKADASYHLCRNMISVLKQERHTIAVSTSEDNGFRYISLYRETPYDRPLLKGRHVHDSYEQWLYEKGALTSGYLRKDCNSLRRCIRDFRPDLVITIDRIAAIAAAKAEGVPCWAAVNSAAYRTAEIGKPLKHLNAFLKEEGWSPVFSLQEVFAQCEKRIAFSPACIQLFSSSADITRIGMQSIPPASIVPEHRICVSLSELSLSGRKLHRLLTDTFKDCGHIVRIQYPGCGIESSANLRFMPVLRDDLLAGSSLIVHDGNPWIANTCISRGIPQLILSPSVYLNSWMAQSVDRNGAGIRISEKDASAELLKKAIRILLNDEGVHMQCASLKEECISLGDLSTLNTLINTVKGDR